MLLLKPPALMRSCKQLWTSGKKQLSTLGSVTIVMTLTTIAEAMKQLPYLQSVSDMSRPCALAVYNNRLCNSSS